MRKCGMQNLSVEAAEAIGHGGEQRYKFGNAVGGDPSKNAYYNPLKQKTKNRKRLKGRKMPKAKTSYAGVRIHFSGGDVVINRPLKAKDVGNMFPSATKFECLSSGGVVLMVLDVPKMLFGRIIN